MMQEVRPDPKLDFAALADIGKLIEAAKAAQRANGPAPASPQAQAPEAIRRLIQLALAHDDRGARARQAWRKVAEGALQLLHILSEDA